jgi:hypothetical protein
VESWITYPFYIAIKHKHIQKHLNMLDRQLRLRDLAFCQERLDLLR